MKKQLSDWGDCWLVGRVTHTFLPDTVVADLNCQLQLKQQPTVCSHHQFEKCCRVYVGNSLFFCSEYSRIKKRNSYTVSYGDRDSPRLGHIQFFVQVQGFVFAIVKTLKPVPETLQSFFKLPHGALDTISNLVPVQLDLCIDAVSVTNLKKCVFMSMDSHLYVENFPTCMTDD